MGPKSFLGQGSARKSVKMHLFSHVGKKVQVFSLFGLTAPPPPDSNRKLHHTRFRVSVYISLFMYTVNHKKRDILFLTITLANLNRFL